MLLLLQANSSIAAFTAVAVDVLGMWLKTVLDDGKRSALKYFTLVSPALCMSERCPGPGQGGGGGTELTHASIPADSCLLSCQRR